MYKLTFFGLSKGLIPAKDHYFGVILIELINFKKLQKSLLKKIYSIDFINPIYQTHLYLQILGKLLSNCDLNLVKGCLTMMSMSPMIFMPMVPVIFIMFMTTMSTMMFAPSIIVPASMITYNINNSVIDSIVISF